MKTLFMTLLGVATILAAGSRPGAAQPSAAQLYPYCQVSSANGGMNCYIGSRAQCEFRELCVANPWYLGTKGAHDFKRKHKPQWRWW
jgi:hypothetical protein